MQLTRFSDFTLRVLMYVHAANDRLVTIDEMAASYRASRAQLMNVVNALTRAGYLAAVRGRTGGPERARSADEIRIGGCCRLAAVLRQAWPA